MKKSKKSRRTQQLQIRKTNGKQSASVHGRKETRQDVRPRALSPSPSAAAALAKPRSFIGSVCSPAPHCQRLNEPKPEGVLLRVPAALEELPLLPPAAIAALAALATTATDGPAPMATAPEAAWRRALMISRMKELEGVCCGGGSPAPLNPAAANAEEEKEEKEEEELPLTPPPAKKLEEEDE